MEGGYFWEELAGVERGLLLFLFGRSGGCSDGGGGVATGVTVRCLFFGGHFSISFDSDDNININQY